MTTQRRPVKDTVANILQADKILGHSAGALKRRAQDFGQEIADLEWARVLIERAVNSLTKNRSV